VTASGHGDSEPATLDKQLVSDLIEANQRIGELEVKLADRERTLRSLRLRLRALEQSGTNGHARLDEELHAARWRVAELETALNDLGTDPNGLVPGGTRAQEELNKIMATKTWRYTYPVRVRIYKMRRRLGGRPSND
jgi:hypothetical protein